MPNVIDDWSRFLRHVAGPEGVPHQVTLEVAEVTSSSPVAIRHRGVVSGAGVSVADHVGIPAVGPCLVAVLSGESNLTTAMRVVIGTF